MLKTIIIMFVFLALLGFFSYASDDIPFRWEGRISVTQIIRSEYGSVTNSWILNPRWKETDRIDVKDKKGHLTGQFVKLDDCGSAWSGEVKGHIFIQNISGYSEKVYSGSGSGPGDVISWGWIYYSLSDDDPLEKLLPNGSYFFSASSGQTQFFEQLITNTSVVYDPPAMDVYTVNSRVSLGFKVGGTYYYEPFGPLAARLPAAHFPLKV